MCNLDNKSSMSGDARPTTAAAAGGDLAIADTFSMMTTLGLFCSTYVSALCVVAPLACLGSLGSHQCELLRSPLQKETEVHVALIRQISVLLISPSGNMCTSR